MFSEGVGHTVGIDKVGMGCDAKRLQEINHRSCKYVGVPQSLPEIQIYRLLERKSGVSMAC